jgi:hypothetical protein
MNPKSLQSRAMRALGKPEVLRSAITAAAASCVACYPRLAMATELKYPVWYLEGILFLGGIVLWAFVFAWHEDYIHRPIFTFKLDPLGFGVATITGVLGAVCLYSFVDPSLRVATPREYPTSLWQWIAMTLFSLTFTQLFLVFAPFAWSARLFRRVDAAAVLTVLFGVFVLAIKQHRSPTPAPALLFSELLLFRAIGGAISVWLLFRGGVLLVWWCDLLIQSRYLFELS